MSHATELSGQRTGPGTSSGAARRQLALIAAVQICAMSLWFSASVVVPALRTEWGLSNTDAALLTAAVQVGFVSGALLSAVLNLADRVAPPVLIAVSAASGAAATALFALFAEGLGTAIALRFLTGVALAGVYPVGMKLVATWFRGGRGTALGVMVAALTVGSALPHLLTTFTVPSWRYVLVVTALLGLVAAVASATLLRVGPDVQRSTRFAPDYLLQMFADRRQRRINLGYFGHMWELYALWTWMPAYLAASYAAHGEVGDVRARVGLIVFTAIGIAGGLACVVAGRIADRHGHAELTIGAMTISGACCLLATFGFGHPLLLLPLLLVWGAAVIADSAQFSAALTEAADPRYVGTALTAQVAIGFLITLVTIQTLPLVADAVTWRWATPLLAIGPVLGVLSMMGVRTPAPRGPDARGPNGPRARLAAP